MACTRGGGHTKDARIRQRKEVEKSKTGIMVGAVKVGGWGTLAAGVVHLLAKAYGFEA